MDGTGKDIDLSKDFSEADKGCLSAAIEFDLTAYAEMLSEMDGSYEEKLQVLRELAKIALGFVDMKFDVHFPQENCGNKCTNEPEDSAKASKNIVVSEHTNKGGFRHES